MGVQMLDPAVGFKHLGPVGCSSGARWELPRDVILSRRFEVSEQLVPIVSGDVGKPGGCCDDPEACARPVGIRELALVIVDQELDFSFRAIKGSVHRRLRRGAIVEAWVDSAGSPWEPNISSLDLQGRVKWSELIRPDIPVPTPWSHAEYLALSLDPSSVSEVGSHQAYVTGCARDAQENLLNHETFKGEIGAFEGAHYLPFGLYRPEVDCRMFSKTSTHYCTVCEETIRYSIEDTSM